MPKLSFYQNWVKKICRRFNASGLPGCGLAVAISFNSLFSFLATPAPAQFSLPEIRFSANAPLALVESAAPNVKFKPVPSRAQIRAQKTQLQLKARQAPKSKLADGEPTLAQKRLIVQEIASRYGIDWKILEAVWQVETGKSWHTRVRSSAGARGPMQFMPGTFRAYAQDGDGDGRKDIYNAYDALASAANMLCQRGLKDGNQTKALLAYNRATWYVRKVQKVAKNIEG